MPFYKIRLYSDDLQVEKNGKDTDNHRLGHNRSFCQLEAYNLNQPASAFPVACYGVSERNKIGRIPYWEDSPQFSAGYASIKEIKMQNMFRISLILLLIITCFVFTASCAKKKVEPDLSFDEAAKQAEEARLEELERQLSLEEERLAAAAEEAEREMIAAREMLMDEDVYFKKGISSLSPEAKEILMKKARWLQDNPDISVIIQGHSDEPGSAEFNLALGEKRAGKVKTFLIKLGISSSRLIPVSYGRERPVASGENKEKRSKNRRVHFVIE